MKKGCFLIVLLLLALGAAGGYYWYQKTRQPPEYVTETVDTGEIRQVISATGSLAALTTVEVGCQISGIVASVSADFNDRVTENQQIAQIDPSTYEASVRQATANYENAQASEKNLLAQIENYKASLISAQAEERVNQATVKKGEVAFADAERTLRRTRELLDRKLISQADLDTSESARDSTKATVEGAKAQVDVSRARQKVVLAQIDAGHAQLQGARSQIKQTQAQLSTAQLNLEKTRIFSPIDGVIIDRTVDVGQTVAASFQAPKLFTIAKDLREMQINVSVDEADIGQVKEGQTVTFSVDAYRGRTFQGVVRQVRLSPTVTQNVVNYSVMVDVKNEDFSLKPGMTANAEILVDSREKVTRIPTRALFFKPSKTASSPEEPIADAEIATKTSRVWMPRGPDRIKPVIISAGMGNNTFTEVIGDGVKPGDEVVVEERKVGDKGYGNKAVDAKGVRDARKMQRQMR